MNCLCVVKRSCQAFNPRLNSTFEQIVFPYDRIYPGEWPAWSDSLFSRGRQSNMHTCAISNEHLMRLYVRLVMASICPSPAIEGSLCTRDAVWNWQDGLAPVLDCFISTGTSLLDNSCAVITLFIVLPHEKETHLLFSNRPRNRKGTCRT
jgi:hypothetical protein